MRKVKALSRLAGGNLHGCSVGRYYNCRAAVKTAASDALRAEFGSDEELEEGDDSWEELKM